MFRLGPNQGGVLIIIARESGVLRLRPNNQVLIIIARESRVLRLGPNNQELIIIARVEC